MSDDAFLPWSSAGCTFDVAYRKPCGEPGVLMDGIAGRRCAEHPSVFDPVRAVALMVAGQTETALRYVRWSA